MADEEINYTKEVLTSDYNLGFVGIMLFLMITVNSLGFLPFLLAGELGALFIAQHPRVQRVIRARKNKDKQFEIEEADTRIVQSLPPNYQADYHSLDRLCEEIEKRASDLGESGTKALLAGLVEKLSIFRHNYARMLRAHHLLSARNYRTIEAGLDQEIRRVEKTLEREQSVQVQRALEQNLKVLQQRQERIRKLDELVRLLEARLQVTRNSLGLIQDEVYTFTDIAGISSQVNNLLSNLNLTDEFRTAYEDVLNTEDGIADSAFETQLLDTAEGVAGIRHLESESEPEPPRQSHRARRLE